MLQIIPLQLAVFLGIVQKSGKRRAANWRIYGMHNVTAYCASNAATSSYCLLAVTNLKTYCKQQT